MDQPLLFEPQALPQRRRGKLVAAVICWTYLLLLAGLVVYLRTRGDRDAQATIVLFSPRWIFAAPVGLLLPLLFVRGCRLPIVLMILIAVFPLMGFNIGRFTNAASSGQKLRIVTFNLHQMNVGDPAFQKFLADAHPDVVVLEESPDIVLRRDLPADLPHVVRMGEICLACRYRVSAVKEVWDYSAYRFTLATPAGPVDLIGVHLASPHYSLRDSITDRPEAPQELARNIAKRTGEAVKLRGEIGSTSGKPLLIAGDFNLVPDSPLFTGNFGEMSDAFNTAGRGFGWTYFHFYTMVRIDHVLANNAFQIVHCTVGPKLISPHRPLIVDVVLKAQ